MSILFQPAPEGTTHFLRFASGHVVWCKVEQGDNNQLILKEWDSFNQFWVPGIHAVEHYHTAGLMSIDDFPGESVSSPSESAPTGATHYYSHGGEVSWYRETENGLFVWLDGSWYASTYKTALDLAKVCPLGAVSTFGEGKKPEYDEDDLTWLARNVHKWIGRGKEKVFRTDKAHGGAHWTAYPECLGVPFFTKDQWLARRAELQNKPSWEDWPDSGIGAGYAKKGEALGDWRDTLERRPQVEADITDPFDPEFRPVSVSNDTALLEQPVVVAGTGNGSAAESAFLIGRVIDLLRTNVDHFSADELADLNELTGAELTKRDAAVCGGQKHLEAHWYERGELPPVGTVCLYVVSDRLSAEVEITAHAKFGLCFVEVGKYGENYVSKTAELHRFRPIRTERDELIEVLKGTHAASLTNLDMLASAILAAGFKREGGKI